MTDKEIADALESFKDGNRAPWVERRLSEAYADLSLRVAACHESHERDVRQLAACRDVANELRTALTASQERERVKDGAIKAMLNDPIYAGMSVRSKNCARMDGRPDPRELGRAALTPKGE